MESSIAPGFLVAAPHMRDPYFERTVVFLLEHENDEGSMGLVINRTADIDLATVLSEMALDLDAPVTLQDHPPVLFGGPVAPELGWIIHTPDWAGSGTKAFDIGISVTASLDILKAIVVGEGPSNYMLCLGYAGWGPGQLIEEIRAGAWINVPFKEELVFSTSIEERWSATLASLGIDPSNLAPTIGDA